MYTPASEGIRRHRFRGALGLLSGPFLVLRADRTEARDRPGCGAGGIQGQPCGFRLGFLHLTRPKASGRVLSVRVSLEVLCSDRDARS